jgi:hypothetical protein
MSSQDAPRIIAGAAVQLSTDRNQPLLAECQVPPV